MTGAFRLNFHINVERKCMFDARAILVFLVILLVGLTVTLALTQKAHATAYKDACGVSKAKSRTAKAARVYREARYVQSKTIYYSRHDYSDFAGRPFSAAQRRAVGRWVWLARRVGWPKSAIDQLMHIIARESTGNPRAKNPVSTASGLLQFLSDWWYGKWNPFNPRSCLRHGYLAWKSLGFGPWAVN